MNKSIVINKTPTFAIGVLFTIIISFVFMGASTAQALSCMMPSSNADFVANGGVIFEGVVNSNMAASTTVSPVPHTVEFTVSRAWGGSISTPFTIIDNVPAVGGPPYGDARDPWGLRKTFNVGSKYIVYATKDGNTYKADIGGCARSVSYSSESAASISTELGQGYSPTVSTTGEGSVTDGLLAQIQSLLALVASLQQQLTNVTQATPPVYIVNDFNSCFTKTGVVLESYPRKCIYNGQAFTEIINTIPRTACPAISQNLWLGVRGSSVASLQQFLRLEGVYTYPSITGYYGMATQRAVQMWQAQNGVVSYGTPSTTGFGLVGPATRSAIARSCGGYVTPTPRPPVVCTLEYSPVCGLSLSGQQQTYGNACQLNAAGARHLYSGQCNVVAPINQAPVIQGLTGPTTLNINEAGTWRINASDPENGSLSYSIDWGDSVYGQYASQIAPIFTQSTTFTHSYNRTGTFTVRVTVRDNEGLTSNVTATVHVVGGGTTSTLSCMSFGNSYPEGYTTTTISPQNDGTVTTISDAVYVCRSGNWDTQGYNWGQ